MPHHSQDLFNVYKGKDKYIEIIKGGHNSIRKLIIKICNFLKKHLKGNENNEKESEMIIENDNNDEYDEAENNEDSIDNNKNIFKNKDNNYFRNFNGIYLSKFKNNKNLLKKEKSEEYHLQHHLIKKIIIFNYIKKVC